MANPIVTAAKAALKNTSELDAAAKGTAEGFSDEMLSKVGVAHEAEGAISYMAQYYDLDYPLTHSGGVIESIEDKGVFGGIFATPGFESHGGVNLESNQTTFYPRKGKVASEGDLDLDYQQSIDFIKKKFPDANDDTIDRLYEMIAEDKNVFDMEVNPLEDYGFTDLGEASWEGQRLRGKLAMAHGFDAIAMDDETGVSYLMPAGTKAIKASEIKSYQQELTKSKAGEGLTAGVTGVTAFGGMLTSEEAKAEPLTTAQKMAALMDAEGNNTDAQYTQTLAQRKNAEVAEQMKQLQAGGEPGYITPQILGGVADAVNETFKLTKDIGDWLNENVIDLGGITWDDEGVELASGEEIAKADKTISVPTVEKAGGTAGGIVRGISQFIAGFAGAGKLKALQAIKPTTTSGKVGKGMAQGAIADFTVFDPQEERLSNLVNEYPSLKNPISNYLAADPSDSNAEGRFKNALEGLALGGLTDTAIVGLGKGLSLFKQARQAKKTVDLANGGLGTKTGERFDPDITPQDIEAALNATPKDMAREVAVKPDDLVNQPKVDVNEGEVFVNWGRIDTPDDVKTVMRDMADAMKPDIDEARRGKQSFEQIQLNAEGVDAWDVLQSRRAGAPLNAEQSVAARELWARSADNLARVSKQAALEPSPANLMAFKKMASVHQAIQREVIAARTETARALASWRIPTGSMKMDDVESILSMSGGTAAATQMARRIADLAEQGMIKEMDEFVEKSVWAKSSDAVKQLFYASLLSGPKTHIRNIAGTASAMAQQVYERKAANMLGQALGDANVANGEAFAMVASLMRGTREAFVTSSKGKRILESAKAAKEAGDFVGAENMIAEAGTEIGTARKYLATGKSGWGTGKVDEAMQGAFDPEIWNVQKESMFGRGLSLINNISMLPTNALGIMDEITSTIGSRMEINARAVRQASSEVNAGTLPQDQLKDRIQYLIDNPSPEALESSRDFAKQITFTGVPESTGAYQAFSALSKFPVFGTIIMPFVRTPFNIAKYTFERTPLAPLVKSWRDDLAAGGARADLALAKTATGTMIMLGMADLALNGDITGEGPSDYRQNEQLRRTGWQPNSIRVMGDDGKYKYYGIQGMEPFSTPIMLASNMVEIMGNSDIGEEDEAVQSAWLAATLAVANQVTSQQYMSGVSSFFETMNDPKRYGQNYFNRLAGTTVPTAINELTKFNDPYVRTAYDMADAIRKRTPGLSKDLPVNTDVWGRPISYRTEMGAVYDMLSPVAYSSETKAEPIDVELNRLEKYVAKPSKKTNFDGVSINLRKYPKAYADMIMYSNEMTEDVNGVPIDVEGGTMLETLNAVVTNKHKVLSFEYNMRTDGSDGGKAQMIQSIVTKFQTAARKKVLQEHPDVMAEYQMKQTQKNTKYNLQGN